MQPAIFTGSFATGETYTPDKKRDVYLMSLLHAFFEMYHNISTSRGFCNQCTDNQSHGVIRRHTGLPWATSHLIQASGVGELRPAQSSGGWGVVCCSGLRGRELWAPCGRACQLRYWDLFPSPSRSHGQCWRFFGQRRRRARGGSGPWADVI